MIVLVITNLPTKYLTVFGICWCFKYVYTASEELFTFPDKYVVTVIKCVLGQEVYEDLV